MKNLRKLLALILATTMLLSVVGCGSKSENDIDDSPKEEATEQAKEVTVTDYLGREVTLGEVKSIALAWYMADDFPLALGAGDRIVAVGPYDDFHATVCPALKEMDSVGRGKPDMEKLAQLNPDLLIHKAYDKETIQACEDMGINVIGISAETSEETLDTLKLVGKALGLEDRANMLCDYYNSIMDIAKDKIKDIKPEDYKSFLYLGKKDGSVADGSMMQAQMVSAGGGRNLAEDIDSKEFWPVVGMEQIFEWNPEFIFLSSSFSSGSDVDIESLISDPAWKELQAVKNGNVFVMPSTLHAWENCGLAPCLGTVWSMMKMYPELYSEKEFDKLVEEFYKTVYNLDLDREALGY